MVLAYRLGVVEDVAAVSMEPPQRMSHELAAGLRTRSVGVGPLTDDKACGAK